MFSTPRDADDHGRYTVCGLLPPLSWASEAGYSAVSFRCSVRDTLVSDPKLESALADTTFLSVICVRQFGSAIRQRGKHPMPSFCFCPEASNSITWSKSVSHIDQPTIDLIQSFCAMHTAVTPFISSSELCHVVIWFMCPCCARVCAGAEMSIGRAHVWHLFSVSSVTMRHCSEY